MSKDGLPVSHGWERYGELVLHEIRSQSKSIQAMHEKLTKIEVDLAGLKVKASAWGAIAGFIPLLVERFLR